MIQYQILQTNITRTVWQTVKRITNEIFEVKGLVSVLRKKTNKTDIKILLIWINSVNYLLQQAFIKFSWTVYLIIEESINILVYFQVGYFKKPNFFLIIITYAPTSGKRTFVLSLPLPFPSYLNLAVIDTMIVKLHTFCDSSFPLLQRYWDHLHISLCNKILKGLGPMNIKINWHRNIETKEHLIHNLNVMVQNKFQIQKTLN